jgi:hypothetical protein
MLRGLVVGVLLLGPSLASGEELRPVGAQMFGFVGRARPDGHVLARQVLPATQITAGDGVDLEVGEAPEVAAVATSRIVYLNKNGVTLQPGDNDSRINRSTIVTAQTAIPPWTISATNWTTVVTCMRDLFAAYDVQIVDSDPGNVPHMEAVFGGSPTQIGMDTTVLGVSPFTLDCAVIENSVVFTFTGAFSFSPREACEVMAQEVAHSYGLDHELLASDPMTYLDYVGNRTFRDQTALCGEEIAAPRACGINGSVCRPNQNSVQLLKERLGLADAIAPLLTLTTPPNFSTVPPGFVVKATGSDNKGVTGAVLKIDGIQADSRTGSGPFVFTTPRTLSEGAHTVVVELTDGKNFKSEMRSVSVKIGAPPLDDTGEFDNDVIGGCAAGRGTTGTLFGFALLAAATRRPRRRRRDR